MSLPLHIPLTQAGLRAPGPTLLAASTAPASVALAAPTPVRAPLAPGGIPAASFLGDSSVLDPAMMHKVLGLGPPPAPAVGC